MADIALTPDAPLPGSPDPVVDAGAPPVGDGADAGTGDAFDVNAFIADLDAKDAAQTPAPSTETPAADAEAKGEEEEEGKEPAAETKESATDPNVTRARKMLAAAAKKERKALESVPKAEQALIDQFLNDTAGFIKRAGKTTREVLLMLAGTDKEDAPAEEDRVTALERRFIEQESRAKDAHINELMSGIHRQVSADTRFPHVNRVNAQSMVTDTMVEYHQMHGTQLPWAVAAAQVENYLKTLAGAPTHSQPAPKAQSKQTPANSRPGQVTLTNSSSGSQSVTDDGLPSDPEARADAVARSLGLL